MKRPKLEIEKVVDFIASDIKTIHGSFKGLYIDNIADAKSINEQSLDWINSIKENKQLIAEKSKARIILVDQSIVYTDILKRLGKVLLVVDNPKATLAKIGVKYFIKEQEAKIHETAIVDAEAIIGSNVNIGAYSIIGKCKIGNNTYIDTHVRIHDYVMIGENCLIKAGAVLGGEGFGFERDENGNLFQFPQIGHLIIGNHVEIGSNTCIDRGALSNTAIDDYAKIDNLVHIAHNTRIGKNAIVVAHAIICGSCNIERDAWIAPNSAVRETTNIGSNAVIGLGAVVIKDVPKNETWIGNPAKKIKK